MRLAWILAGLMLLVPALSQAATQNKHAVAVIIGNKTYGDDTPSVDFAHNDADAMTKLTKAERRRLRQSLGDWQAPRELLRRADALMDQLGVVELFNQAGVDFITEAWAAATFAGYRQADAVRLVKEAAGWPDFEMRMGDDRQAWEFTEALEIGRRRGDEFAENAAAIERGEAPVEDDPFEDWIARADQVPAILETAVRKKVGKRYGGGARLLIYLNIQEFGARQSEIEASFRESTAGGKGAFPEIWILWKARAYRVWVGGEAGDVLPHETPTNPTRNASRW